MICNSYCDKSIKLPIALQIDPVFKVWQIFFSFGTDCSFTETGIVVKQAWDVFKVGKLGYLIIYFPHFN